MITNISSDVKDKSKLSAPSPNTSNSRSSTPGSPNSFSTADVVRCDVCPIEYRGKHRRSTLSRHKRLKHSGNADTKYECEQYGCNRVFKRQDARLKHYRSHHPHLANPMIPRGSQRSRAASTAQASPDPDPDPDPKAQDYMLRSMSGWTNSYYDSRLAG